MKYKIRFPTGWTDINESNDNIDINVVLENGEVYWGIIFSVQNIEYLMKKEGNSFFSCSSMAIVSELNPQNIHDLITSIVDSGFIEDVFSNIGTIEKQFPGLTFQDIPDVELDEK
jgi:hypothetical protein